MADKWEYMSVTMEGLGGDGEVSRLGEDGWELVSVVVSEYLPGWVQPKTDTERTMTSGDDLVVMVAHQTTAYLKRRKP